MSCTVFATKVDDNQPRIDSRIYGGIARVAALQACLQLIPREVGPVARALLPPRDIDAGPASRSIPVPLFLPPCQFPPLAVSYDRKPKRSVSTALTPGKIRPSGRSSSSTRLFVRDVFVSCCLTSTSPLLLLLFSVSHHSTCCESVSLSPACSSPVTRSLSSLAIPSRNTVLVPLSWDVTRSTDQRERTNSFA